MRKHSSATTLLHTTLDAVYVFDQTRLHTLCPIYVSRSFSLRSVILFDRSGYVIKRNTPCVFFPSNAVAQSKPNTALRIHEDAL